MQALSSPDAPRRESPRPAWLMLGFIAVLYVGVSFAPVIFDDNEGLYADAVREMHTRHDWLVPMSNGFPRVQKPPLVYWTMLISTGLLGESEFALRLPNALATAGWIMVTYLMMRRIGGERFGMASAAALASMLGVWIFTHLVQPEPFLACSISASLWCLIEARGEAAPRRRWFVLFWLFLALGTMSKGLHGALWPLGVAGLLALLVPSWRSTLRGILQPAGWLVFALITVPWYFYMALKFPHFLSAHFMNEQVGAALDTRYPRDARQLSVIQFYLQHLIFWMPWTLLLPGAIYSVVQVKQFGGARGSSAEADGVKLLVSWIVVTLVSVAFSTRQDYYSMGCWGAVAALLVAPWTMRQMAAFSPPRAFLTLPAMVMVLAGLAGLILWTAFPHLMKETDHGNAAPIAQRDTFMDAISGISPGLWSKLLPLLSIFGIATVIGGGAGLLLAWRRMNSAALLVLAATMAVPMVLATRGFVVMSPYFSLEEIAGQINRGPLGLVACEALPNTASSLLYYLNGRVHWVNAPFDNQYAQRVLGEGRDYYWDQSGLTRVWSSGRLVYFIVDEDRLPFWQAHLQPAPQLVRHSGTRDLLVNRPVR